KTKPDAVSLFSGGLDSTLAVCILKEQGLEVHGLWVRTMFESGNPQVEELAQSLGIDLTVRSLDDDYIELLKHPPHGYGSAVNPCIDCRIYMMKMAKKLMEELGASFVASGEVVGQRPMSQKRADFDIIEKSSGLVGRLLRPLSAKLVEPTIPEKEGLVDRKKLFAFSGRGRGALIELADKFGVKETPTPSTGCRLTEKLFAPRLHDLIQHTPNATRWDFELLNVGRHIRINENTKVVIGRNEQENSAIQAFASRPGHSELVLVEPESFMGPDALLLGKIEPGGIEQAAALVAGYSRRANPKESETLVSITDSQGTRTIRVERQFKGSQFTMI
ncbi:MAG: hypothetical protein JXM70_04110, partial [Pirellulales bacterium]|nr:hypothetical protein [Pirellulales bacterium]